MKSFRLLLCFLLLYLHVLRVTVSAAPDEETAAITIPSADVTLSFIQPGRIAEVNVKDGDPATENQILIRQDDSAEQAQLEQFRAQSEDTTQIEANEATLAQKKLYLKKIEWASQRNSATELEVEQARLDVKIAELSVKLARFEHDQNTRKYEEAKIRVDQMSLKSPIAGKVEKIEVEVGEVINGVTKAVRVVNIDPLWINVPAPLEKGKNLKVQQTVKVRFPGSQDKLVTGRIVFVSTVADAASDTMTVRIEVPNKSGRMAGEHVNVVFP